MFAQLTLMELAQLSGKMLSGFLAIDPVGADCGMFDEIHLLRSEVSHEHFMRYIKQTPTIAAAWLPTASLMTTIDVLGIVVKIYANDEAQQYEARIDGAVCAVQDYDGIRMDQNDPEFPAFLASVFTDGAQRAYGAYVRGLGPIYV